MPIMLCSYRRIQRWPIPQAAAGLLFWFLVTAARMNVNTVAKALQTQADGWFNL